MSGTTLPDVPAAMIGTPLPVPAAEPSQLPTQTTAKRHRRAFDD